MSKKTIQIDHEKCTGCGLCASACHEGAIGLIDGKAELIREDYCDGLGACLPVCPTGAITFIQKENNSKPEKLTRNWPLQIKLVPVSAPYFENADLLVAADCTAFSYANFHDTLSKNKIVLIGCPKLDEGDYSEKLTEIFKTNHIKSITVARMEVPCCTGILNAVKTALTNSDNAIELQSTVIGIDGSILFR